ncbi:MAG: hypothetical protein M1838_003327, partial [Thelocarpon superellum]
MSNDNPNDQRRWTFHIVETISKAKMGSQSREKYERLQAEDEEPLRKSLDDAYDSASDEDLNLGELDPLHGQ